MANRSGWCRGCSGQMEDVVMWRNHKF